VDSYLRAARVIHAGAVALAKVLVRRKTVRSYASKVRRVSFRAPASGSVRQVHQHDRASAITLADKGVVGRNPEPEERLT